MSLDPFQPWLVVVVAVGVGWFAAGVIYNIRHGNAVLRWLQEALPRIGGKTTLRWLGTSVVELKIERAKPPFRRVHLLLVVARRGERGGGPSNPARPDPSLEPPAARRSPIQGAVR